MKKLIAFATTLVLILALAACGQPAGNPSPAGSNPPAGGGNNDPVLTFKLAENQPESNPVSQGMFKFAELVHEKTNGTITIDVYVDGQLGDEGDALDQVRAGTLDFVRANAATVAPTVESVSVFTLPFVFTDMEHKYKVLDGEVGREVLEDMKNYNIIGLEYLEAGSRNFYTSTRKIESLADVKGLKLRVMPTEVAIRMVELMGGSPTPMNFGEVYQGLQTGVVDGAENDFVSYYTSGHYEVAPYYTLTNHTSTPAMILMSASSWDKMSASQQAAVREAAREAALWQRVAMDEFQNESRDAVVAGGAEVIEVDMSEFQNSVGEIYDMYPQFAEVIARIQALQ